MYYIYKFRQVEINDKISVKIRTEVGKDFLHKFEEK